MAISLAPVKTHVIGDRRRVIQDVTLDSSYPTGGYPLTPTQLGCDLELNDVVVNQGPGGIAFQYDYTNQKLKGYYGGGAAGTALAEIPNTTNVSTVVTRVSAIGKGTQVFA